MKSVVAHCQRVYHQRCKGEDNSVIILEFEGGGIAVIEDSWVKHGGMDDRVEIFGTKGAIYCDLLHGSSMETYSLDGYGYAMEKAGETKGWTFTVFEEAHIYGFPHEMRHFTQCVLNDETPRETGEDGVRHARNHLRRVRVRGHGQEDHLAVQAQGAGRHPRQPLAEGVGRHEGG